MALEMVLPAGTIPVETAMSYETPGGSLPIMVSNIVDRANTFHIKADWQTSGPIFNLFSPTFIWKAEAIFEEMGPGEFGGSFTASTSFVRNPGTQSYSLTINIPGASVPQGIYRIILKLSLDTGGWTPICGFDDMGLVEFYN